MFDHGCDCFTIAFQTLMLMKTLQIGNNFCLLLGLLTTGQTFYFSILEEYYIGELILGVFNGVTDGSILVFVLYNSAGFFGNQIFLTQIDFGLIGLDFSLSVNYIILAFLLTSQSIGILIHLLTIVRKTWKNQQNLCEMSLPVPFSFFNLFVETACFYLNFLAVWLVCECYPKLLLKDPLVPCFLFSFVFVQSVLQI